MSIQNSFIIRLPEARFNLTREEYLIITCGNACAATLLNVLEWLAGVNGKDAWFKVSMGKLAEMMLYQYSRPTIEAALDDLAMWGFLKVHDAPEAGADRRKVYRLRWRMINRSIVNILTDHCKNFDRRMSKSLQSIKVSSKESPKVIPSPNGNGSLSSDESPKQVENHRRHDLALVFAEYHHAPASAAATFRGRGDKGTIGQFATVYPAATKEDLKTFLSEYAIAHPDWERISKAETLIARFAEWQTAKAAPPVRRRYIPIVE